MDGNGVVMSYPAPLVTGGTEPVLTTCTPSSPALFPVGTTTVTCTAKDAESRTATCSFPVTVLAPPRISATKYIAFGDSMSDGVLGFVAVGSAPGDPGPAVGYAYKLRTLLQTRYTAQSFMMTDEGCPGEHVIAPTSLCAGGVNRLPTALSRDQPEVVLLLEGVNDINGGGDAAIPTVIDGLRQMIREARGRGLPVFLGNLLPENPNLCSSPTPCRAGAPASIPPTNAAISGLATAEGAILVDLYGAFDGQTSVLIGPDGLHPNDAGYQKMADTFFASIRAKLELPQTSSSRTGYNFGFTQPGK